MIGQCGSRTADNEIISLMFGELMALGRSLNLKTRQEPTEKYLKEHSEQLSGRLDLQLMNSLLFYDSCDSFHLINNQLGVIVLAEGNIGSLGQYR